MRELRVTVEQPGFRVNELVLVTTLLDSGSYSKQETAQLFLRRWNRSYAVDGIGIFAVGICGFFVG